MLGFSGTLPGRLVRGRRLARRPPVHASSGGVSSPPGHACQLRAAHNGPPLTLTTTRYGVGSG
jgi:hypothetical protein